MKLEAVETLKLCLCWTDGKTVAASRGVLYSTVAKMLRCMSDEGLVERRERTYNKHRLVEYKTTPKGAAVIVEGSVPTKVCATCGCTKPATVHCFAPQQGGLRKTCRVCTNQVRRDACKPVEVVLDPTANAFEWTKFVQPVPIGADKWEATP